MPLPFRLRPLLFLVGIFLLNFLSRIALGPLMPIIEQDLGISHTEAGSFFLYLSLGYCIGLLSSGFVSRWRDHRDTIFLSAVASGLVLLALSFVGGLLAMCLCLLLLGIVTGLYLPSGIATVIDLADPRHRGKALAVHELAPNTAFVVAPLLAEALVRWFSWRGTLAAIGVLSIGMGIAFRAFGQGSRDRGEALRPETLRTFLREPSLWIMMAAFGIGIGASYGVYNMLPLFLVAERGMDRTVANALVGISRASGIGIAFVAGWASDRLGPRLTIGAIFFATGVSTIALGAAPPWGLIPMVFLQPMLAAAFFAPALSALSHVGPPRARNVAVALTTPVGFLIGGGAIPAAIGAIGDWRSLAVGLEFVGLLTLGGTLLLTLLRIEDRSGTE